jgi:hypothetical protein
LKDVVAYMRWSGRTSVVLLTCLAAAVGPVSTDAASQPNVRAVVALHLRFKRLPYKNVKSVQVSGSYALLTLSTGNGSSRYVLVNDRTDTQTKITAPHGCYIEAMGAPWIYCASESHPRLYDMRTGRWRSFSCRSCYVTLQVEGIGADWIWLLGESDQGSKASFASIPGGRKHTGWRGGNTIPDLDSANLVHKVCSPLEVPAWWDPTYPPPFTFYGRFTTTTTLVSPVGAIVIYLERCGTNLHMQLATGYSSEPGGVIGNPRVVAFYALDQGRATGVFLPSLRRLSFSLPVESCSYSCATSLDARRLYFIDGHGHAWAAAFPLGPARSPKH